jgi:peptidoglycan hydrolase-like protein with peptidoglycan-binding domain
MLQIGSRNTDVSRLQKVLNAAGFRAGSADGIFGANTKKAVVAFQRKHHLQADGVVGDNTGAAIFKSRNNDLWDGVNDKAGGSSAVGFPSGGSNRAKLNFAGSLARRLGLTITSTTGGRHAPGSYHYRGRAIDVAGSPARMAAFFNRLAGTRPTELFYDPRGGIKNGRAIGAIGGHGDHVHVAY